MHEMSVAMSIVEIAVSRLQEAGGTKILKVKVTVGELSGVSADSVLFCYDACARGTPAEGSQLQVDRSVAKAICRECAVEFRPEPPLAVCPECGAFGGKIINGEELFVDEIEVE